MTKNSSVPIVDPIREGLARWKVHDGGRAALPAKLQCNVAIVGSGSGAGITADLLTAAGLSVVIVEEGPFKSSSDFRQLESEAYPALYQESASRITADKAIGILRARCVVGSTTVNWTSSFRTPSNTLKFCREHFALPDLSDETMSPWFLQVERRLSIGPWLVPPNANNQLLQLGAARLGIASASIPRSVKACWNLGSCGLGCPTNAKQSMLVTTLPAALDRGAVLLVQTRALQLDLQGGQARGLRCAAVAINGEQLAGAGTHISARHVVVAGGAINSPGLLLRSHAPDPHSRLGVRTFLHPVVASTAVFSEPVGAWHGAPRSMYSDHFLDIDPVDGPIGYKLEAPPLHPLIASTTLAGFGADQTRALQQLPYTQALLALLQDGFHPQSPGGRVKVGSDGLPVLDYPLNEFVFDGAGGRS